jgi:glyoxylase I family protein
MGFTVHHTGFTVSDMDRAIPFYRDLLGLRLVQDAIRENLPSYDEILGFPNVKIRVALFLDAHDRMLELVEYLHPRREVRDLKNTYVGAAHMSFAVADLDREYERLKAGGVRFNSPPVRVMREGKYLGKSLYMFDPDGITVELYEPVEGK